MATSQVHHSQHFVAILRLVSISRPTSCLNFSIYYSHINKSRKLQLTIIQLETCFWSFSFNLFVLSLTLRFIHKCYIHVNSQLSASSHRGFLFLVNASDATASSNMSKSWYFIHKNPPKHEWWQYSYIPRAWGSILLIRPVYVFFRSVLIFSCFFPSQLSSRRKANGRLLHRPWQQWLLTEKQQDTKGFFELKRYLNLRGTVEYTILVFFSCT